MREAKVAGRLARRFGESRVLATGMLLFGTSLVLQVLAPVAWFPAIRLELGALTIPVVQGWIIPIVMAIGACGMSLAWCATVYGIKTFEKTKGVA